MANITTGELSNSIPTVIAAQALGFLKANTVMARLVNRDWDSAVATYGQTVLIPYGGSLSVNNKSTNTVVSLQTPSDAAYTVTLNKHKEVSFLIEDTARAFSSPNWLTTYTNNAMAVVAEAIDADLTALYSGLSQTIDATTGLAEDDFRNARRLLNAARAPIINRRAVLHEDAEYEALGIEKVVNNAYSESLGNMAANAFTGRFGGFDIFMDQMIAIAGGEAKNMFFHRDAMVLVTRPLPAAPASTGVVQRIMDEDGVGLRVTMSYNPNHLGVQITIDVLYGVAELRDSHGVVVRTTEI